MHASAQPPVDCGGLVLLTGGPLRTTCLISNYNYASYVGEAIDGALRQTEPFDEIIVVDDGSTDGSLRMLKAQYGQHPCIQIIGKENQGQLSCFNEGFSRATGDIVFFLDADDVYEPDYVQQALDVYRRHRNCDFLFCGRRLFGRKEEVLLNFPEDRDLGYSVVLTAFRHIWIGAPTSCLSMQRHVLNNILPLPFVDEWRVRADDCLIYGASLAGARKRFLAQPLVRYRVHESNHYFGKKAEPSLVYLHRLAVHRLCEYLERKLSYNVLRLAEFHHREFRTIQKPTFTQLMRYSRIGMGAHVSLVRRVSCIAEMISHYLGAAWRGTAHTQSEVPQLMDPLETIPLRVAAPENANSRLDSIRVAQQRRRAA